MWYTRAATLPCIFHKTSSGGATTVRRMRNSPCSMMRRVMRHLQAGNTDAFAVIFKRYHRLVHVTALHILRDAAEAEDLTQSVFLEIYRKAGQFDSARGTLKVWLLQYAYSRSANRRNYLLVRQVYNKADVSAIDEAASLWSPGRLQLGTSRSPEALASLPDAQRQTIGCSFSKVWISRKCARRRSKEVLERASPLLQGLGTTSLLPGRWLAG